MPAVSLLRPLPRRLSRPLSILVLLVWVIQMGWLLRSAYARVGLAGDLARYGNTAHWKGIYYRGEKIGFSVSETLPVADGYELREEAQLRLALLGDRGAGAQLITTARVDASFALRSFRFSLDPGTGPITLEGVVDGRRLTLTTSSLAGARTEVRELEEPPALSLNLSRRLAAQGLEPGKTLDVMVFDPATMRNAAMHVEVQAREVVRAAGRPTPAFRVSTRFGGVSSLSWITDLGEVVREESPTGFIVVDETRGRATARAVPGDVRSDLLEVVAVKPVLKQPITDPRGIRCLRLRLTLPEALPLELDGAGQQSGPDGTLELYSSLAEPSTPAGPELDAYRRPEPFIESDAPEIRAEAEKAVANTVEPYARAERLARYVNALLEKKPTIGLPSAREVLRTRIGDCNEHTALYVAMARSLGIPARIAVGLAYVHGAFYYHAWPEVYVETEPGRGRWIAVDPTLNQFPADVTHLRLVRGGLDRQAAILPLIGRMKIEVLQQDLDPLYNPVVVGREAAAPALSIPIPQRNGGAASCWSRPN